MADEVRERAEEREEEPSTKALSDAKYVEEAKAILKRPKTWLVKNHSNRTDAWGKEELRKTFRRLSLRLHPSKKP